MSYFFIAEHEIDIIETINSAIKKVIPINDLQIQIDKLNDEKKELENNLSTLVDTKVKSPGIPDSIFNIKYNEYMNRIREITHSTKQLEVEQVRMYDTTQRINKIDEFTRQKQGVITKLDNSLKSFVFKMISVSPSEMVYCIAGSKNYSDAEFSKKRKEFLTIDPIATGTYYSEKYDKKMNYKVIVI